MQSCCFWLRAAPWPLGSLFGSFSPCGARPKGDQQPDGRVARNQSIQGFSRPVSYAQVSLVNEVHTQEVYPMRCTPMRCVECTPERLGGNLQISDLTNGSAVDRWSICRDLSCKIEVFALRDRSHYRPPHIRSVTIAY